MMALTEVCDIHYQSSKGRNILSPPQAQNVPTNSGNEKKEEVPYSQIVKAVVNSHQVDLINQFHGKTKTTIEIVYGTFRGKNGELKKTSNKSRTNSHSGVKTQQIGQFYVIPLRTRR